MGYQQDPEDDLTRSSASTPNPMSRGEAQLQSGERESAKSKISTEVDNASQSVSVNSWIDGNRSREETQDRLTADRSLIQHFANKGYRGREYRLFCEELARYALNVMMGWLATGRIFLLCEKHDRPVGRPMGEIDREIREDLAVDTVAAALHSFCSKMRRGEGWHYEGGASLTTYFMTGCIYEFARIYRGRKREQQRQQFEESCNPATLQKYDHSGKDDIEATVLNNIEVEKLLQNANGERRKAMLILISLGYSHIEIAEILSYSSDRAVEGDLYRFRKEQRGEMPANKRTKRSPDERRSL